MEIDASPAAAAAPTKAEQAQQQQPQLSMNGRVVEADEPILRPNPDRFVMFPIKYHEIWERYKKHEASFWTADQAQQQQPQLSMNGRV
ncbi:Ribonucleotide-diphosphate reductase (RNR), small subunit, partial [Coemansia biformis]